jgi:hypothetical protein
MLFRINCPYCKEKIKRSAVRCKHCQASLGGDGDATVRQNEEDIKGIQYLENGFSKIYSECEKIEEKMKLQTGFVFIKHQYSSDELCYAVSRIESFVEKMRDDLDEWESVSKLSGHVRFLFNKKAEEAYGRLESLHYLIEQREPTWWEKVKGIVKRIVEKLLSIFPLDMIAGKIKENMIAAA